MRVNPPVRISHLASDTVVSFIPMDSVADGATGEVTATDRKLKEVKSGYTRFRDGDILWARITPCMQNGKSFVAEGLTNGMGFGSTEFHVLRRKSEDVTTEYVWEVLCMQSLRRVAIHAFTGSAGHQRVPGWFLGALPLPVPSLKEQARLVAPLQSARNSRRARLAEADALIGGMDSFLQEALGYLLPPKDNRRVYAVRRAATRARFDPHFHLPAFAQNSTAVSALNAMPLGSLAEFSDEVWRPKPKEPGTFRYIEIANVNRVSGEAFARELPISEAPSRARMRVREHDIIVSLTRPRHGSIARITPDLDGAIASTGFSILRNINNSLVTEEYLWCTLRAEMCLSQMLQRASGGNYPAITEPELAKVLVPVPDRHVQDAIATEYGRRRTEAGALRMEADAEWRDAGQEFERKMLGTRAP
jgi:hypothetical protein